MLYNLLKLITNYNKVIKYKLIIYEKYDFN